MFSKQTYPKKLKKKNYDTKQKKKLHGTRKIHVMKLVLIYVQYLN